MINKKITSFENLFPDDLLQLEIDEDKLQKIFPDFYKKLQEKKRDPNFIKEKRDELSDELNFIKELIEENHDRILQNNLEEIDKIYKEKNSIILKIKDGDDQKITNTSIINFHGTEYDGHSLYIVDSNYLLLVISKVSGQAGSLGIWDARLNNWCFKFSDEGFNPISFNYDQENDSFNITSSSYSYGNDLIEKNYLIDNKKNILLIN